MFVYVHIYTVLRLIIYVLETLHVDEFHMEIISKKQLTDCD